MLFFIIGTSNAETPLVSLSDGDEPKTLVLNFDAESTESTLKLVNQANETLLTEKLSDGTFNRKLNLKNLEQGIYYFSAENDNKSVVYTIEVDNTSARVIDRSEKVNQIVFREVGELVQLNLFNPESHKVTVDVLNEDGSLLFNETIKKTVLIGKQFNFENAFKGEYTIKVSDGQSAYQHKIEIL